METSRLTEHVSRDEEDIPTTSEPRTRRRGLFQQLRLQNLRSARWLPWVISVILLIVLISLVIWATAGRGDDDDSDNNSGCSNNNNYNYNENHKDTRQPVNSTIGSVASDNPVCSQMGAAILKQGGNAVDATITTVLCLGVLNPFASGIGGGAAFVVRTPDGKTNVVDSREVAPAAASTDMYQNASSTASTIGGLAVAVPGELRGLERIYQLYSNHIVSWTNLVLPVAVLAKNFSVGTELALRINSNQKRILATPSMAAVFAPNGVPLIEGDFCYWTGLSKTLTTVAQSGVDAFYTGPIAEGLAADIQAAGGIVTVEDLNNYEVVEREAVTSWYHGFKVISAPPPFGGVLVSLVLNIIEGFNFKALGWGSTLFPQYLVEALKFAYDDRMALGDPAFVNITDIVNTMLDKEHAMELRQKISPTKSHELQYYEDLYPITEQAENHGTSHLSIVDGQRMAVATTTTINLTFGAFFISNNTGVLLNDQMDDFSIPGKASSYNVPPSPANYIMPGKRPLSSMSPTIILQDNQLKVVVGASGGTRIPVATLQASINVLDFEMNAYDAVASPRIHEQLMPYNVYYESDYPKEKLDYLEDADQLLEPTDTIANTQCVLVLDDDTLQAGSDWRKQGLPAGY